MRNLNIQSAILIGDTHFGIKNFNLEFFNNQLKFFEKQIIPYMKQNNIQHLIQTGDLLDNRTTMDIKFLDTLYNNFVVDILEANDIHLITFLGNHDIYYKNTREVNLIKYLSKLCDNITCIDTQTTITLNGKKTLLVPWLLENETIQVVDESVIIGHFEIKDFQVVKGSFDTKSSLDENSFGNCQVYSGHYHINQKSKNIHYIGTPYQLNWNDFGNKCGFYIMSDGEISFQENTTSKKHTKIIWDEHKDDYCVIVEDDDTSTPYATLENIPLMNHWIVKVFNKYSKHNGFEDLLFRLKELDIPYTFINEQELETIINPDNKHIENARLKNTDTFVLDYVKENHPELVDLVQDILKELKVEE